MFRYLRFGPHHDSASLTGDSRELFFLIVSQSLNLINLLDKLVGRRKIQLVLTCKDCLIIFRQRKPHSRIVLVRAQQYSDGRILVGLLLVAVVIIDI